MRELSQNRQLAILMITTAVVLLVDAGVNELHGTAVFYASLIREMHDASDLLYIFRGEQAYLLKPPLVLWLSTLSADVFGLTNFGVSLVPRLAGIGCVFLVYAIASERWDHRCGWIAALVMLTNSTFLQFTATLRMDSLLLFGGLLSIYAWLKREQRWAGAGLFAGITIGVLSKGPLGFAPLIVIAAHMAVHRRLDVGALQWRWAWLLLPIGLWYGYLYSLHGMRPFLELGADAVKASGAHNINSFQDGVAEYVLKPLRRYWPWIPFMLFGVLAAIRQVYSGRDRQLRADTLWLLLWFLIVFIAAFSKPDKDIRYLYSGLPPLSIMTAFAVSLVLRRRLPNWFVLGLCSMIVTAAILYAFGPWGRTDTRETIAELKMTVQQHPDPLIAIGGYPVHAERPRRQNTHRDWIHFYLGREPVVYSWREITPADLSSGDGVLLTRSRGHEAKLQEYGLSSQFVTTEMIYAVRK